MLFVGADQKGKSVKLHPQAQDKIFTDVTDDGQDVVVVKGRVVRVDSPSPAMGNALSRPILSPDGKVAVYTLLVETDEPPTPLEAMVPKLIQDSREAQLAQLSQAAARLGFVLSAAPSENVGDVTVDKSGKASVADETKSSDSKASAKADDSKSK